MPKSQNQAGATSRGTRWAPWVILGAVCALVIGFFAWSARPGWLGMRTARAEDAYYNQMVRGFRAGQLDLKAEVPPGFAHLADPYDPAAHLDYLLVDGHPLWDLSYYHGKWYAYFGVAPALVKGTLIFQTGSNKLTAVDVGSERVIWEAALPSDIVSDLVRFEGSVYVRVNGDGLLQISPADGKVVNSFSLGKR